MRTQCERILLLACDMRALLGYILRGLAHGVCAVHLLHSWIRIAPAKGRIPCCEITEREPSLCFWNGIRRAGHRLDSARDIHLPFPHFDGTRGLIDGVQT